MPLKKVYLCVAFYTEDDDDGNPVRSPLAELGMMMDAGEFYGWYRLRDETGNRVEFQDADPDTWWMEDLNVIVKKVEGEGEDGDQACS